MVVFNNYQLSVALTNNNVDVRFEKQVCGLVSSRQDRPSWSRGLPVLVRDPCELLPRLLSCFYALFSVDSSRVCEDGIVLPSVLVLVPEQPANAGSLSRSAFCDSYSDAQNWLN